ncbi:MAG: glycosyltransferase family 4 protein [Planctomycetes bacterium]|nr:glycosyltransferase family 4 protein [Planctomycetota bacterium]
MKLGVNIIRLTRLFTGVGRYIECILKEWSQMKIPFEEIILYTHSPIKQEQVVFPLDRFKIVIDGSKVPDPLWEWNTLRRKSSDIDILFCPSYTMPIGYPGRCVVANHGPAENTFFSYQWWRSQAYERLYKYSAHKADGVLANSHSVKRRLVDVYGISQDKINVIHLAASDSFHPISDKKQLISAKRKYLNEDTPYILFVGKLARRHYIPNLLEAFAKIYKTKSIPHKLLLVGPDYLNLNIPKRAKKLGIEDAVIHIPYVTHTDLPPLYNAAELFIFPASEAEGFGIPVVEAMACGTPVVTVDKGSLSEFARDVTCLVKDSSVEHLKSGMERLIFNPALRKELAEKGIERARSITWRKTAEKTMDVLWQTANG